MGGKRKVAALEKLEADFASLQYKIRRDPKSYHDEFARMFDSYLTQRELFLVSPSTASAAQVQSFHDLIEFLANVSECYPESLGDFPEDLKTILTQHHAILDSELREKVVGSLVLLRRKEVISSASVLPTLFAVLTQTQSKTLRTLLFQKILSDLRNSNSKATNHKLNRTVQNALYTLVTSDRSSQDAIYAVKLIRELWKRQIWTDAKPVDIMREVCLADNEKVVVSGTRFFLGVDKDREDAAEESSDDEAIDIRRLQHQKTINKKTKKKKKAYEKAIDKVKKTERKKNQPHPLNFSALHLLQDPQGFCEALFAKHLQRASKFKLESKLLVLQLVSRLTGLNKLIILPLYSWIDKYLVPRQQSVTSFLAYLAMATHDHVPPESILPLVDKIRKEFVSEGSAAEVAAAGMNAIREVCARQPLAMNEDMLQDLVQFGKSKDKGVMMASKGLLSLYREAAPELLLKKDRGKTATMGIRSGELKQRKFGEQEEGGIEGLELLEKWKEEQKERKRAERGQLNIPDSDEDEDGAGKNHEDEYNSSDWDVESIDSSDSGGWINVSDSEDEQPRQPAAKRQKTNGLAAATAEEEDEEEEDKENAVDEEPKKRSTLATTSILTPADLAKLQELRMEANVDKAMGGGATSKSRKKKEMQARHVEDGLTAEQIEMPATLRKTTKEERVALAQEGKPNREEHKSTMAIKKAKKAAEGKSTTNKEKAKKKNQLMMMGKARAKNKRSLVQTQKVLRAHVDRSKRGGRRRNGA